MESLFISDPMDLDKINLFQLIVWMQKPKLQQICDLQEFNLLAKKYLCPVCGMDMVLSLSPQLTDGYVWRCQKYGHNKTRSIRKGSWFENSRMTICDILMLTYMWCNKYPPHLIKQELGIVSTSCVTEWLKLCREVCIDFIMHRNESIGGEGKIVEIDVCKFGKRKYSQGKCVEGQWVFGGVERGSNKCFLVCVKDRSKESILDVIKKWIATGSTIYTDTWNPYDCLGGDSYTQLSLDYSISFTKSLTLGHQASSMEGFWRLVKTAIPHQGRRSNLFDGYLAEAMYRKFVRDKGFFIDFLKLIVDLYRPNGHDI